MPVLGWVPVRKEAESLSECLFLPFHPKPRPTGSLNGAVSRSWGHGTEGAAGFGGIQLHEVLLCSDCRSHEWQGQCCGQSCYRGPLDVPRAVQALWLSPRGAIPQPLPAHDDAPSMLWQLATSVGFTAMGPLLHHLGLVYPAAGAGVPQPRGHFDASLVRLFISSHTC